VTSEEKRAILEEIARDHDGLLVPADVVEVASDPEHPLHGEFEWDNDKAAHEHRLWQARVLIHGVRVEIEVHERAVKSVFYVQDPRKPEGGGYLAVPRVQTDRELAERVVAGELSRATSAIARAREVSRSLGLESELDELLLLLQGIERKLQEARAAA
jgi:hypothetical protein